MMVVRAECLSRPSLENVMYEWAWRGEHVAGPARGAVIYQDPGRAHDPGPRRIHGCSECVVPAGRANPGSPRSARPVRDFPGTQTLLPARARRAVVAVGTEPCGDPGERAQRRTRVVKGADPDRGRGGGTSVGRPAARLPENVQGWPLSALQDVVKVVGDRPVDLRC